MAYSKNLNNKKRNTIFLLNNNVPYRAYNAFAASSTLSKTTNAYPLIRKFLFAVIYRILPYF